MPPTNIREETTMGSDDILVVGLNPALQKRFLLRESEDLVPGKVHRSDKMMQQGIGGKGQDVAVALACLSPKPKFHVAQFVGQGAEGDEVLELLQRHTNDLEIGKLTVRTQAKLRTCTTIIGASSSTELVEPSGTISPEEYQELLNLLKTCESHPAIVIMGSMPPGCHQDTYAEIVETCCASSDDKKCFLLVDSVVGLKPLLHRLSSLKGVKTMIKINVDELINLTINNQQGSRQDIVYAKIAEFIEDNPYVQYLAVTDGKDTAYFAYVNETSYDLYALKPPSLEQFNQVLYPIGAGDAVSAGTIAMWKASEDPTDSRPDYMKICQESADNMPLMAFQFGLACASASCLNEQNSSFEQVVAIKLFKSSSPPEYLGQIQID